MNKLLVFVLLLAIGISSCDNNQKKQKQTNSSEKLKVFAVNYPLLYFAERIGGEQIDLVYPIPEGVDPAYWVPYKALEDIQSANLILANGANYAKWMEKVSLSNSKVVNTSEAFEDSYIEIQMGETHSHGGDGDHVHYGYAFTTWLDIKIAIGQAESVKNALILKRPEHKAAFTENFNSLKSDLQDLDKQMRSIADKLSKISIFASHPVYQYLAKGYSLEIVSEHWEPGEMPTEKQWKEFEHNLEHHPSNIMLWEDKPDQEIEDRLLDKKIQTVVFNPCSNKPANGDFIAVMRSNINNLKIYAEGN